MDELANPYRPGAGTPPPALTGRDDLINRFGIAFRRAVAGRPGKSLLMIGLRGAGKTVLLNRFVEIAEQEGFRVGLIEAPEHGHFPSLLAARLRRILLPLEQQRRIDSRDPRAARAQDLHAQLPDGTRVSIDVEALHGVADSGNLADDVTDLLVACGEAARDRGTGIVLAIDELQYVQPEELSALIVAIHRTNQLNLPVILTGAGLPQLRGLAGEAKSYAERLFDFPEIGSLECRGCPHRARRARAQRAARQSTTPPSTSWSSGPTGIHTFSRNGDTTSGTSRRKSPITADDVDRAAPRVQDQLDQNFFLVRLDRLTPREREYLVAMASLGPGPHRSGDIAGAPRGPGRVGRATPFGAHRQGDHLQPCARRHRVHRAALRRVPQAGRRGHRLTAPPRSRGPPGNGSLAGPVDTVLRIGNASGFYGDRFPAFREMLEGGATRRPDRGLPRRIDHAHPRTPAHWSIPIAGTRGRFSARWRSASALALERGVTIVTNAGGLNPSGLASAIRDLAAQLGLDATVATVEGDDVTARAAELGLGSPLTANAYLGAWGIAACVRSGADVVVTGRVTDASLVVGPAAAHFDWQRDDWDALAGATVAGHILECGDAGHGRQLQLLHRARRAPSRLSDRGDARRRIERDHQAPGHRRGRHHRDGHCAIAL